MNILLILLGKLLSTTSRFLNLGSGSTWPGHIALSINKNFIKDILKTNDQRLKTILVAGTNGKTTTAKLIQTILEKDGKKAFINQAGANLLNGIASSLALHSTVVGRLNFSFAIFEIDENTLPLILKEISNPDFVVLLNLFRDQLDRYGEVNTIAKKWKTAIEQLNSETILILNADDPQIAFLGLSRGDVSVTPPRWNPSYTSVFFFGLEDKKLKTVSHQHASDSTYCPNCGKKLIYNSVYFSHLGDWECKKCGHKHPDKIFTKSPYYPLVGTYNEYNTNAAVLLAKLNNISNATIEQSLRKFKPAFGRQEDLIINDRKVKIFLSKNPTSFNESLRTIASLNAKNLLIVLNDRIPDGRDVSWIWDVDFEDYKFENLTISGDRAYDMALRIKYSTQNSPVPRGGNVKIQNFNSKFKTYEDLNEAIQQSLQLTEQNETLYILPTYSAMLEVRKILTGKKIL